MHKRIIHLVFEQIAVMFIAAVSCFSQDVKSDASEIDFDTSVRLALENSYEILISKEEIAAAGSQLENAKRGYYPKVRLQSSARADLFALEDWNSDEITTGLILDWDPYQGGELMRRNAEARMNYYIAKLNREDAVMDIVLGIQELYYNLLKSQYTLDAEAIALEIEKQKLDTLEAEFKAGRIKEADVLSARTAYFEMELSLQKDKQAYGIKLISLENKLQQKGIKKVADVERNILTQMDVTLENCIKTAYVKERKYLTVKQRETLARLGVKYSRLKRYPSFSFFTTNDYAVDQSVTGEDFGFRVGLIASYPLYDAGETRSIIRAAESYLRKSELDLRKEKEARTLDVTEKYYKLMNQMELLKISRDKEKQFTDDWKRAEADFKSGAISQVEYDKFRHAFTLSNNRLKELELDVMLAESNLLRSMGISGFSQMVK